MKRDNLYPRRVRNAWVVKGIGMVVLALEGDVLLTVRQPDLEDCIVVHTYRPEGPDASSLEEVVQDITRELAREFTLIPLPFLSGRLLTIIDRENIVFDATEGLHFSNEGIIWCTLKPIGRPTG